MSIVPQISDFRNRLNKIANKRDATLLKVYYLTASRVSEIITSVSPSDRENTQPYGVYLKWFLDNFETQKVLVLKLAIAKRKKEELIFKNIGLPVDPKFESWTLDLLRYIKETGNVTFSLTRQRVRQIVKTVFPQPTGGKKRKNILRHYRLTHLADYYGFNGDDIITYAGWTFKGQYGTGQLDTYLHLDWRKYFRKLLKPQ